MSEKLKNAAAYGLGGLAGAGFYAGTTVVFNSLDADSAAPTEQPAVQTADQRKPTAIDAAIAEARQKPGSTPTVIIENGAKKPGERVAATDDKTPSR